MGLLGRVGIEAQPHTSFPHQVCGILQAYLSPHQLPYSLVATVDGAHPGPVETIAFCSANTLVSSGGDTQVGHLAVQQ